MRPSSADTSEPAWVKRKMLSTKNSTSWPWSRKCSATVRPERPTRARAPGGSFICPYTSAHFEPGRAIVLLRVLVHAGLDHLVIEVVAFAGALANAGEHRIAAVRLRDVVDQLHDQHGLADAGAAEQPDLAALRIGSKEIHDLDAGDEDFRLGRLVGVGRRILMDGALLRGLHRSGFVDRIADDVDDAAEALVADRHGDRLPVSVLPVRAPGPRMSIATVAPSISPRCCATSSTSRLPPFVVSSAFRMPADGPRTARPRRRR